MTNSCRSAIYMLYARDVSKHFHDERRQASNANASPLISSGRCAINEQLRRKHSMQFFMTLWSKQKVTIVMRDLNFENLMWS